MPSGEQREFIRYLSGAALLHAPVGTGKTRALAERAACAIQSGVKPNAILCVTFTNRAAEELRQRVTLSCGEQARQLVVSTFHSLCAWMLRAESQRLGLPVDFVIYDDEDSRELLTALQRWHHRRRGRQSYRVPEEQVRAIYYAIQTAKVEAALRDVVPSEIRAVVERFLPQGVRHLAAAYDRQLRAQHALDFADLILYTRAMLNGIPDARERWEQRFDLVQVDEVQDTHMSEYLILRVLAARSGNLVLAGDFDQTIYEWRGSRPDEVLARFEQDFPGVRKFNFTINYRSTRVLLQAAASVAAQYSRHPPPKPHSSARHGAPVVVHFADDEVAEASWIGHRIRRLRDEMRDESGKPIPLHRIAVLVRPNRRAAAIARILDQMKVPCVTVDAFEFFRRQEIKDVLAYVRVLLNPADWFSFRRLLRRPPQGIGDRTVEAIQEAAGSGLRLVDMVSRSTREYGDPYGELLHAYRHGAVTIFDTETTGLRYGRDEIVELAAVRLERGRPLGLFHKYLRNTVPVGESEKVHGLSDDYLRLHGEDPPHVLREFAAYSEGSLLVGHNVAFDMRMLRSACVRHGLPLPPASWADTFEIARRFLRGDQFSLESLAERLQLSSSPTHRADADVGTTRDLLERLVPLVEETAPHRRQVVARYGEAFVPLAERLDRLAEQAERMRPPDFLAYLIEESGLHEYYADEPRRLDNMKELVEIARRLDDLELDSYTALEAFLGFAALAKNVDALDPKDNRVRVLTVHQAKGLEFVAVFVAGLTDSEFPNFRAVQDGREREELRIFYVAVTRARERLFLSGYGSYNGYIRDPSPYLSIIERASAGSRPVEPGSSALGP